MVTTTQQNTAGIGGRGFSRETLEYSLHRHNKPVTCPELHTTKTSSNPDLPFLHLLQTPAPLHASPIAFVYPLAPHLHSIESRPRHHIQPSCMLAHFNQPLPRIFRILLVLHTILPAAIFECPCTPPLPPPAAAGPEYNAGQPHTPAHPPPSSRATCTVGSLGSVTPLSMLVLSQHHGSQSTKHFQTMYFRTHPHNVLSHLERRWTWLFGCHPSACVPPGQ